MNQVNNLIKFLIILFLYYFLIRVFIIFNYYTCLFLFSYFLFIFTLTKQPKNHPTLYALFIHFHYFIILSFYYFSFNFFFSSKHRQVVSVSLAWKWIFSSFCLTRKHMRGKGKTKVEPINANLPKLRRKYRKWWILIKITKIPNYNFLFYLLKYSNYF